MSFRRVSKIDSNQPQIVKELRELGCTVLHTHVLKGCFDILVGYKGKNFAFEIKDPQLPPSKRKLTQDEQKFMNSWQGQVNVIHTSDEAMKIICA